MGMLVQAVLFDLDDTLISTGPVYRKMVYDIIDMIGTTGIDVSNAHDVFQEIEVTYIARLGFKRERFPRSLAFLYRKLCMDQGREEDNDFMDQVYKKAVSIYEYPHEVLDGAEQLLQAMKYANYRLILVTKGDDEVQRTKVERAGLAQYFNEIIVVPDKTPEIWAEVAEREELRPHECFVVGDSVKSDVNASILAGFNAIHIPPPHEWFYEKAVMDPTAIVKHHISELLDTFKVRHLVSQAWAYHNKPSRDLKRAAFDGYMLMVPAHDVRERMPNCPGLSYLFTQETGGGFQEIYAVFERNYVEIPTLDSEPSKHEVPAGELTRVQLSWAPGAMTTEAVLERHKHLPSRLCEGCSSRGACRAARIVDGVTPS